MEDKSGDEVASPVGRCYCLPENPGKLWLHVAGHCPAVKSADVVARERLQRGGGSPPSALLLSYCLLQQSIVILQCAMPPQTMKTMVRPPIRRDNPRARASGLSNVQADRPCCIPCVACYPV